ncbi:MAG: macro domain-containing protein [Lachnospiraceae bacterium]|nr:macro domain-containing protein [Lachnospiraceae bacterium]
MVYFCLSSKIQCQRRKVYYGAYYRSLELAAENGCRSIGFPLLSAGVFGYPVELAWSTAFSACQDFLDQHPEAPIRIVFAVLDSRIQEKGKKALAESEASRG